MSGLALRAQELVAGYTPEADILRGVSIEVRQGEIVTVLGPNGAGKSTLIKAIAGMISIRSGSVLLFDEDITGIQSHLMVRHGLAYVPQTDNVFARLSIEENLEMGAYAEPDPAEIQQRLDRLYLLFPRLGERRWQAAGSLSGGERQMVAVARALMAAPRLIMLDEPSAGLAPNLVGMVFRKLREVRDMGVTILLVEQNAKAALAISDQGYVLAGGRDRVHDAAQTLLSNPEIGALYLGMRRAAS